jgi:hypothetical protein
MLFPVMKYSTALLLCVLARAAFCTSVAIIRTPTELFVAADSLSMKGSPKGSSAGPDICKIVQVGNTFLAFSGMADIDVSDAKLTSFHGFKLAKKAARTSGTMVERGAAFTAAASAIFKRAAGLMRMYQPGSYKAELLGHPQALAVVFFGMNPDKTPAYDVEQFGVSENSRGEIIIALNSDSCPGSVCSSKDDHLEIVGERDKAVSESNKPGFYTGQREYDVQHLVEIEASDEPQLVKGPIDVLRVSALATDWIKHKAQCPDIQSYSAPKTKQPRKKKACLGFRSWGKR